jgi:hypothetical protein
MAKKAEVQATQAVEKKEPTMTFPNLTNNTHILRIVGQDGKVACELRFERDVFKWDKEAKSCDNSRIRLEVHKPTGEGDNMRKVKEFRIATKDTSNMIWMGDMILKKEETQQVESV